MGVEGLGRKWEMWTSKTSTVSSPLAAPRRRQHYIMPLEEVEEVEVEEQVEQGGTQVQCAEEARARQQLPCLLPHMSLTYADVC